MDSSDTGDIGGHHHDGQHHSTHGDHVHHTSYIYTDTGTETNHIPTKSKIKEFVESVSRPVASHEAPALHKAVAGLATKMGIEKPVVYMIDARAAKTHPMYASMRYNAFATQGNHLLVGDLLLEELTGSASGHRMSKNMEALLGHELTHLKYDMHEMSLLQLSGKMPLLGLVAGLGGLALYRHMKSAPKDQQEKHFTDDTGLLSSLKHMISSTGHAVYVTGQYLAAGALGLTAGVLAFKEARHFCEFRADRGAAEALGSPTPVIHLLQKLDNMSAKTRATLINDLRDSMNKHKLTPEEMEALENIQRMIGKLTHPSTEERISRLQALGGEMKAGVGTAAPSARVAAHEAIGVGTLLTEALQMVGKIRV